jgi:hypothetical protein
MTTSVDKFPPRLFFSSGARVCFKKDIDNGRVDSLKAWHVAYQSQGRLDKEFLSIDEHEHLLRQREAKIWKEAADFADSFSYMTNEQYSWMRELENLFKEKAKEAREK